MKRNKPFVFVLVFAGLFLFSLSSAITPDKRGSQEEKENHIKQSQVHKSFDAKEMIMDHILDSYEWHLFTYKDFHCSIPLPIILYSKENGLHVFWSSKFHHGQRAYKGFKISQGEKYHGQIVEERPDGSIVRPVDLSLTKDAVAILFSVFLLLWLFISIAKSYRQHKNQAPHGLQNLLEPLILFIRDEVAEPIIGKKYERYTPYLLSLFFFIFTNNLLGLIPIPPGGANITGNIAIPIVMSLFTLALVLFSSTKYYWIDIFNTPNVPFWLKYPIPLLPTIEFLSLFIKHIVLVIRLFANIIAGHIVALGFFALIFVFGEMSMLAGYGISVITIAFTIFLFLLEILEAIIQAYVFTLLSALYIGLALEKPE